MMMMQQPRFKEKEEGTSANEQREEDEERDSHPASPSRQTTSSSHQEEHGQRSHRPDVDDYLPPGQLPGRRQQQPRRRLLRCIAKYGSFRPQALACTSGPVLVSVGPSSSSSSPSSLLSPHEKYVPASEGAVDEEDAAGAVASASTVSLSYDDETVCCSLGAVAGSMGVAVFSTLLPQQPRLVLSLAASTATTTTAPATRPSYASSSDKRAFSSFSSTAGSRARGRIDVGGGGHGITSLAFQPIASTLSQPSSPSQLYLAAARGSGVLVWDVSGHSLSPLWGRLSTTAASVNSAAESEAAGSAGGGGGFSSHLLTSLCWRLSSPGGRGGDGSNNYQLLATTGTYACLWDLRQSPPSSSTNRPAMRFAAAASMPGFSPSPLVQVACQGNDCAILSRDGSLSLYDLRRVAVGSWTSGLSSSVAADASGGAVASIVAFRHAGIGLAPFLLSTAEAGGGGNSTATSWLTWGLDRPADECDDGESSSISGGGVVRVWTVGATSSGNRELLDGSDTHAGAAISSDEYWCMGSSPALHAVPSSGAGYQLSGVCSIPNLCCARACPDPYRDAVVTVALDESEQEEGKNNDANKGGSASSSWRAQVWRLNPSGGAIQKAMEPISSFRGGYMADNDGLPPLLRDVDMGSLRAAEVASVTRSRDSNKARHLLLCSLTDAGYVMAHAIPDIEPPRPVNDDSNARASSTKAMILPSGTHQRLRVFPPDKNEPIGDAALAWTGKSFTAAAARNSNSMAPLVSTSRSQRNEEANAAPHRDTIAEPAVGAQPSEGGPPLPFDMEFSTYSSSVANVNAGVGIVSVVAPKDSVGLEADTDLAARRDAAELMRRIETDRIPSPRLCGAAFGPGAGGLVCFSNGDVQKVWKWWEKTDPARSAASAVPGIIGELLQADNREESRPFAKRGCPRTLKDLKDMTVAAKEAQWGDQDESDASSTDFRVPGPSFFEDGSDGSSDSGDDEMDEKDMYESYFGESQRPLLEASLPLNRDSPNGHATDKKASDPVGPSSDSLSPCVIVTRQYDKLALSNQSIDLAIGWKLGTIFGCGSGGVSDEADAVLSEDKAASSLRLQDGKRVLPRYRFLVPPSQQQQVVSRFYPDPQIKDIMDVASVEKEEDRGVHGGEYGVRPNMQDNMVFLRKLFSHQQDGGRGYPGLYSPPDGPMLPNSRSGPAAFKATAQANLITPISRVDKKNPEEAKERVGLYIRRASQQDIGNPPRSYWKEVEQTCLHNAHVCEVLGENGKRSVWELLAKAVAMRGDGLSSHSFGSLASGGLALGSKMVANLLLYYEALGDAQMLSTIVCVLQSRSYSVGELTRVKSPSGLWSLLPPNQEDKFDTYIRRYADLLFSWGLLTTRAELNKHLVSTPRGFRSKWPAGVDSGFDEGHQAATSITHAITCPRCLRETRGSNFCPFCRDFAFRCVICDNAVRGLFTSCESCGHGGHIMHLQQWFATHHECPTGCGCRCMNSIGLGASPSVSTLMQEANASSARATTASLSSIDAVTASIESYKAMVSA